MPICKGAFHYCCAMSSGLILWFTTELLSHLPLLSIHLLSSHFPRKLLFSLSSLINRNSTLWLEQDPGWDSTRLSLIVNLAQPRLWLFELLFFSLLPHFIFNNNLWLVYYGMALLALLWLDPNSSLFIITLLILCCCSSYTYYIHSTCTTALR